MDYTIDHALNQAIREHPLPVSIIVGFANWGVAAFGVAAWHVGSAIPGTRPRDTVAELLKVNSYLRGRERSRITA